MKTFNLDENVKLVIKNASQKDFYDDEVELYVVINNQETFITKDSYQYEIGYTLKYNLCSPLNFGNDNLIGEILNDNKNINDNVQRYSYSDIYNHNGKIVFNGNDIAIFIYSKDEKNYFCIVENIDKGKKYNQLYLGELKEEFRKKSLFLLNDILM